MGGICPKGSVPDKVQPTDDLRKPIMPKLKPLVTPVVEADPETQGTVDHNFQEVSVKETPREQNKQKIPKKVSKKDFKIQRILGKGAFGKVYLVKHLNGSTLYAMKCLCKEQLAEKNQVLNTKIEKEILEINQSPFTTSLHFAFQSPTKVYMVMEYVPGGNFFPLTCYH
jgi:hypothetical protein